MSEGPPKIPQVPLSSLEDSPETPQDEGAPISMYEIPGHGEIDTDRYEDCKEKYDEKIQEAAAHPDPSIKLRPIEPAEEKFEFKRTPFREASMEPLTENDLQHLDTSILSALESEDPAVYLKKLNYLRSVPDKAKAEDIKSRLPEKFREALASRDEKISVAATEILYFCKDKDRAHLFKEAVSSGDVQTVAEAFEYIGYVPAEARTDLFLDLINEGKEGVLSLLIKKIGFLPKEKRFEVILKLSEKGLGKEVVEPGLYDKYPELNESEDSRVNFMKKGSQREQALTLLGGSLKGKELMRHVLPEQFVAWQKAYEDFETWTNSSFDYVPIEPIHSYQMNEDGVIDVHAAVLDLNITDWDTISGGKYRQEIQAERNRIAAVTSKEIGVNHGHTYVPENFVLRFFRTEDGQPDFSRVPRVYLIDFDQAKIEAHE